MISTRSEHNGVPTPETASVPGIVPPRHGGTVPEPGRPLRLALERPRPGIVIVRMHGEIDLSSVARLNELIRQRMTAARLHGLVLDLTTVSFCDSSGLEPLMSAQYRADSRGIDLHLVAAGGAVARLLELTGLAGQFQSYDTVTEALARLPQ